jgi:uncharacterized protein YjiS (DUF1127 family)
MRHERFDRNFCEFAEPAKPEERRPSFFRRVIAGIMTRLANRRPDVRDFSDAQLRDIGLTGNDIGRF